MRALGSVPGQTDASHARCNSSTAGRQVGVNILSNPLYWDYRLLPPHRIMRPSHDVYTGRDVSS